MTYYMGLIQTVIIPCLVYELQPVESFVTFIWPLKSSKVKGLNVNWKITYDFVY